MCQRRRNRAGFSLGELMVVIAIVCLLAAIMLPSLTRARSEAHLTSCVQNLRTMGGAYQSYLADHPGIKDLPVSSSVFSYIVPQYLPAIPTCPSSGASTLVSASGGTMKGYVWVWYWYVDHPPYPYVMCLGGHNDVLPASRGPWLGPVWSARSGLDDCRTGSPVY